MQKVNLDEAKLHLLDLIDAALNRETILITKDNQDTIQLVPIVKPKKKRVFGSAKGLITIADDFDEPLTDFMKQ